MVENTFKEILRNIGIQDSTPRYMRDSDYYIVMKVLEDGKEIAERFLEEARHYEIDVKVRPYEDGMDIWVFKAYNKRN